MIATTAFPGIDVPRPSSFLRHVRSGQIESPRTKIKGDYDSGGQSATQTRLRSSWQTDTHKARCFSKARLFSSPRRCWFLFQTSSSFSTTLSQSLEQSHRGTPANQETPVPPVPTTVPKAKIRWPNP